MMDQKNSSGPYLSKRPVDTHPLQLDSTSHDFSDEDELTATNSSSKQRIGETSPSVASTAYSKHCDSSTSAGRFYSIADNENDSAPINTGILSLPSHTNVSAIHPWLLHRSKDNFNGELLWSRTRIQILSRYTTSESSTSHSLLNLSAKCLNSPHRPSLSSHVRQRLEQIDSFEDNNQNINQIQEITNLSQSDYKRKIEQLNSALSQSWETDQRVKALKIVIQCAKLLADVSVLKFYPSKFVLVTDILDNFGRLVDARINGRASQPGGEESAKETCRNWFLKVASIRELTPRIYVELAILRTCGFLQMAPANDEPTEHLMIYYSQSLLRISRMVRGIGNVIVASYVRCYICRIASLTLNSNSSLFNEVFMDSIAENSHLLRRISRANLQTFLFSQKISLWEYYNVLIPSFDWLLQCAITSNDHHVSLEILDKFEDKIFAPISSSLEDDFSKFLILCTLIEKLPFKLIVDNLEKWLSEIKQLSQIPDSRQETQLVDEDASFTTKIMAPIPSKLPMFTLIDNLGKALMISENNMSHTDKSQKLMVLNEIWKTIAEFIVPEYLICARTWLSFTCKYLTINEINLILGDIIQRIQPKRIFVDYYDNLVCMIDDIVSSRKCLDDFSSLFALDNFSLMFDMIQKDSFATKACKITLVSFLAVVKNLKDPSCNSTLDLLELAQQSAQSQSDQLIENQEEECHDAADKPDICINDIVIINQLTHICKILHDSIGPNTFDDELRQMSQHIIQFLRLVSFDIDLNAELNYLAECRASFDKLEPVIYYLVHRCHGLAIKCRKIINRKRKKTPSFINSCLAYSYITIPTIETAWMKASLLLEGAQIALMNSSLSHADAFIKEFINLLFECYKTSHEVNDMKRLEMSNLSNNLLGLFLAYEDDIDLHCKSNLINFVSKLDCAQDATLSKLDELLKIPKDNM